MALKDPKDFKWKILYVAAGMIDIAQWVVDLIVGPGEVGNEVADPFIGLGFGLFFQLEGVSMVKRISRLLSLVGGYAAEALSASVAPAWIVDVWYIHRTVKEEWAAEQASLAENEDEEGPVNRMVEGRMMRQPPVIKPLNQGNARLPNGGVS